MRYERLFEKRDMKVFLRTQYLRSFKETRILRVIAKPCFINHAFLIAGYPQAKMDLYHLYANTYRFTLKHSDIILTKITVRYLTTLTQKTTAPCKPFLYIISKKLQINLIIQALWRRSITIFHQR